MKYYDYNEEVTKDVVKYINENYNVDELKDEFGDIVEFRETLTDELWESDSVTGNASGSYFGCSDEASEAICYHWDLIQEMVKEGWYALNSDTLDPEKIDVALRCYVLDDAIDSAFRYLHIDNDTFEDEEDYDEKDYDEEDYDEEDDSEERLLDYLKEKYQTSDLTEILKNVKMRM